MEIDPRFRDARRRAARRRRRPWLRLGAGALLLACVAAGLWVSGLVTLGPPAGDIADLPDEERPDPAAYASAFVDLPGDPMVLRFDRSAEAQRGRELRRPPDLPPGRGAGDLRLVEDALITREERLITTLPSSREDFAFFQAQRGTPAAPVAPVPASLPPGAAAAAPGPADTGTPAALDTGMWGEIPGAGAAEDAATYTRTRIENTTSLSYLRPEDDRREPWRDVFLRLHDSRPLAGVVAENSRGDRAAAERFAEAAIAVLPELERLDSGHILALRYADDGSGEVPVQLSAYTRSRYLGSVGRSDAGAVLAGADPWVEEDLFSFAGEDAAGDAAPAHRYRLLDAFYSAAIRNGVPSSVVGETIVLLSQGFDLESFAGPEDRMVLLYARQPGVSGPGPDQVLYAAIRGPGRVLECHVHLPAGGAGFACFDGSGAGGGAARLREGMVTPVSGVLTSGFGPRMHPVLGVARLHRGVDWAAPTGTPVVAAFDGEVAFAGDGQGYGNLVRLSHAGGRETRYAHLDGFAEGLAPGRRVRAGEVIGTVGTTGLSTGPHLHFELYEGGDSVDPFAGTMLAGGGAVEALVDRIVRVESAGVADARNPLSTATGLGQFIEGTWLRMMRSYRPDLVASLSREELLALRTDPTLSREMIANLARESEAYLRARGHEVTPGRLYLSHFLGAEGAHLVLAAEREADLAELLGAGVIAANPFLRDRDVAYILGWADDRMRGRGAGPRAAPVPPEVAAYRQVIARLLEEA
ncbi:MAG: M23 family metallopeptidase [Gemmobacter sp.]